MGSLQYEYEWNHGREKEHSLQCGPKLLNGGQASCCGALEGQSSPEKDQGTAPGLQSHQFATAPAGDQVSVDTADGRHPVLYLKNLVESMPRRLEAVILNEGNSTK